MAKRNATKGFDVIAEAHDRAEHNMNPYYWLQKLPLYGSVRRGRTNKGVAAILAPLCMIIVIALLSQLPRAVGNGSPIVILTWLLLLILVGTIEVDLLAEFWRAFRDAGSEPDSNQKRSRRRKHYR